MPLNSLDVSKVSGYVSDAWKKRLKTSADPANGRWYTKGANGSNVGLYGGLNDTLPNGLGFDQKALIYLPKQIVAGLSGRVDNRNGLNPHTTVSLTYKYANSSATSHSFTNSVKVGIGTDIKGKADFIFVAAEVTLKFSAEYAFSYAHTRSETEGKERTWSGTVPVNVPQGRVYQAVLVATVQEIQVPYTANLVVSGQTETWFEDRINGLYNWRASAGDMFGWINQYGTAGSESALYRNLGNGTGALVLSGVMTAQQTADFTAQVYDVTDAGPAAKTNGGGATASAMAVAPVGESLIPDGVLVETINFEDGGATPAEVVEVGAGSEAR